MISSVAKSEGYLPSICCRPCHRLNCLIFVNKSYTMRLPFLCNLAAIFVLFHYYLFTILVQFYHYSYTISLLAYCYLTTILLQLKAVLLFRYFQTVYWRRIEEYKSYSGFLKIELNNYNRLLSHNLSNLYLRKNCNS